MQFVVKYILLIIMIIHFLQIVKNYIELTCLKLYIFQYFVPIIVGLVNELYEKINLKEMIILLQLHMY